VSTNFTTTAWGCKYEYSTSKEQMKILY